MELLILPIIVSITIASLGKYARDKTPNQLMLLGIEITIIGAAFMISSSIFDTNSSIPSFLLINSLDFKDGIPCFILGLILMAAGITVNIYGFRKK